MRFNIGQVCRAMSPYYLFNIRIPQVVVAIIYLTLLCYCGVHHGWWLNLQAPLGIGSACSPIMTLSYAPIRGSPTWNSGESLIFNLLLRVPFIITRFCHYAAFLHSFAVYVGTVPTTTRPSFLQVADFTQSQHRSSRLRSRFSMFSNGTSRPGMRFPRRGLRSPRVWFDFSV